ncbi:hypothetical protein KKG22_03430 [Patescibacteria group bacterium]|nr:hypothetical protein [Patescibacteria group bacterium]MBU1721201.1 hypothetical protein [Patescibacteria group bacterium]MBU1901091.1 hypothetical protein [Patescibacteria group bacterium]
MAPFLKKQVDPLSRYVDASGTLGVQEFRLGYWYIRNKQTLRKIAVVCLSLLSGLGIVYSLFMMAQYAFVGYWDDINMYANQTVEFMNYTTYQTAYTPRPLGLTPPFVYASNPQKYDIATIVTNKNDRLVAHVRYHYTFNNTESIVQEAILWPLRTHVLPTLGVESDAFPKNVQLVIDEIQWNRVDPHIIFDVQAYIDEHVRFLLDNATIERQSVGTDLLVPEVRFEITNNSIYNFWDAELFVDVKRGNTSIAILPVTISQFLAGETRLVTVRSFADISTASSMNIIPAFDVFDEGEYFSD